MNEIFAADPDILKSRSDLRLLLQLFGPFSGRYLASYPVNWSSLVEGVLESHGEVEAARVKLMLRRASESCVFFGGNQLPWRSSNSWLQNASSLIEANGSLLDAVIANQSSPPKVHDFGELDLPATADERIFGVPTEYARVSKTILLNGPEIAFVDPYLDPRRRDVAGVLDEMLKIASKGRTQRISIWARALAVCQTENLENEASQINEAIAKILKKISFKKDRVIEFNFVQDESSQAKMHGRYILSIKGGVRLDQGLQALPKGRRVDAGPIGRSTHSELVGIFFENLHDMTVQKKLVFRT